jgi:hypothetical protein
VAPDAVTSQEASELSINDANDHIVWLGLTPALTVIGVVQMESTLRIALLRVLLRGHAEFQTPTAVRVGYFVITPVQT